MKYHENPSLLVRTGSHLYGCNVSTSDEDTRGFAIPPINVLLGRIKWEQYESKVPDCVIYNISKFFALLEKSSPNTIEILFANKANILHVDDAGQTLLNNRELFLSKQIINPTVGFAISEWKKVKDSGLKMSTKNGAHVIRLLGQGIELLETGNITYPRPNADFLLKVRNGEICNSDLEVIYNDLRSKIQSAHDKSTLNENIDKDKLNELYIKIIKPSLRELGI